MKETTTITDEQRLEEIEHLLVEHESTIKQINNEFCELRKKLKLEIEQMDVLTKERDVLSCNKIFNEYKHLENLNTLNAQELQIIYKKMDKRHYIANCPRYIDLEYLLKSTIHFKKRFGDVVLTDIHLIYAEQSDPPKNYYSYTFTYGDGSTIEYRR